MLDFVRSPVCKELKQTQYAHHSADIINRLLQMKNRTKTNKKH